jgi:site-specific DNA-methyltransferase (adenine-specific)
MKDKSLFELRPIGQKETSHPNEKPVKFVQRLVNLGTKEGETILDPFMGSGTTLVAAKLEGRKAVGIEISEKYCELAANRLRQKVLNFEEAMP